MTDFDQKLREGLGAEDAELLARFDQPALLEQVIETFRGRNRWIVTLMIPATIAWLIFACVSAYQFFHVEELRGMIAWAGAFAFSIVVIGLVKIWYWMELNKNSVTREVKRLELQVAQLAARLKD
jgi:uncharacterized membrane protein YciS (DUF1049 family)